MSLSLRTISREQHLAYIQSLSSASHCQVPAWADVKNEWRSENLGWFVADTDHSISGNMGYTLTGEHRFGAVVGPEWEILAKQAVDAHQDLTFTYTLHGQAGTFEGNLIVVPEPSGSVMLLGAVLGLLIGVWRRRCRSLS